MLNHFDRDIVSKFISFDNFPSYSQITIFFLALWFLNEAKYEIKQARIRKRSKECGGRFVPLARSTLPFGLSFIVERYRVFNHGTVSDAKDIFGKEHDPILRNDSIRTRCLGIELIHNRSPLDAKHIFTNEFKNWKKSKHFTESFNQLLGEAIITSNSKQDWSWHRNLLRPHFSKKRISDFNASEEHIARVINWIERKNKSNEIVNFQDIASRFTLTTGSQHFFGQCLDMLNDLFADRPITNNTVNATRFSKALESIMEDSTKITMIPSLIRKLIQRLTLPNKSFKLIFEIVNQIILQNENREKFNKLTTSIEDSENENLVNHLRRSGCSTEVMSFELTSILLASRDTTASLLTSCIYELTGRDGLWQRLKSEVSEIPNFPDTSLEQLSKLKLLRAVINESLRLHTVLWLLIRTPIEDEVLPSGIFVPAGTDCAMYLSEIHRDPTIWGEDANEFLPERWLDGREIPSGSYLPFIAGPRVCIGQQFAITEVTVALVRLLQSFSRVELVSPSLPKETLQETGTGALTFRGGLWVKFHKD
ncbi:cytochrome P450 monooxygenase [Melampsora americana]|nr:cytochrome P450 monooxygenase [Melampsora americana]